MVRFTHGVNYFLAGLFLLAANLAVTAAANAEDKPQQPIDGRAYTVSFLSSGPSGLTPPLELGETGSRTVFAQSRKELAQAIGQNSLRINQLEEQMRTINGRVEELLFEIRQLRDQIRLMQEDNEFRFQELEGGKKRSDLSEPSGNDLASSAPLEGEDTDIHGIASSENGPVEPAPKSSGNSPLDLSASSQIQLQDGNSVENGADGGFISRDPLLQSGGVASLGTLSTPPNSDPESLYNQGYTQLLNGNYDAAERSLRDFVESYSVHPLASDAQYWLAETYFARGQYGEAVKEFSNGYQTFPQSNKAPDTLLKLGISLAALNENDAACATLREVFNRFPNAPRSVHLAARDQQVATNCAS